MDVGVAEVSRAKDKAMMELTRSANFIKGFKGR